MLVSFWISVFFIFFWYMPNSEIVVSYGNSFLLFCRTSILFLIVTTTIYIPTNSVLGFPILHILISSVHFRRSVLSDSLHEPQHARPPCPSPYSCPWSGMPSNHLILSSPSPALNLPQHQGLFQWVSSSHQQHEWLSKTYWAPTDMGSLSFSVISFHLFILLVGFSGQEYWNGLPFPSPMGHILSELSTMTRPSWVALHGMAHSFIELDKAVIHVGSFVVPYKC